MFLFFATVSIIVISALTNVFLYQLGRKRGIEQANYEWEKYVAITEELITDYIKDTNDHISGIVARGKPVKKETN